MSNKTESCLTCKYYEKFSDAKDGPCHRFPPVLITPSDLFNYNAIDFSHPIVDPDDWCGEYKIKEDILDDE